MAKARKVNYFAQISSDEDFEVFLQKKGLIILDVYQAEFGPCAISLHGAIEKAKISLQDSDTIQLAVCDVDKIEKLERFRKRCIPTILFCSEGKVVDVVYGANVPLLLQTIATQLNLLEKARKGEETRTFYEFDEPVEWERADLERIKNEKDEAARILKEQIESEEQRAMDEMIALMTENASDMGVTIFMPHVIDVAVRKTATDARRMFLVARSRKIVKVTAELLKTLEKKLEKPISEDIKNYLEGKDVLAVLWNADPGSNVEDDLKKFVQRVTKSQENSELEPVDEGEEMESRLLEELVVYLDEKDEQELDVTSENGYALDNILRNSASSGRSSSSRRSSDKSKDDERPKIVIPPVWAPNDKACNCLVMFTLFRNQFEHFLPPIVEPEPPHLCMMFPASKHNEVLKLCKDFVKDLLAFGFFTSTNLNDCQLICKSPEKYEQLDSKDSDAFILKVAKRTSHFSLALTSVAPVYVSHNVDKGAEECTKIFNVRFQEADDNDEGENPVDGAD